MMMMKFSFAKVAAMALAAMTTCPSMMIVVSGSVETPRGFRQFGQTLVGNPTIRKEELDGGHLEFGSVVRMSDDGTLLAVGAPFSGTTSSDTSSSISGGRISLYQRDDSTIIDAVEEVTWRPIWELVGAPNETVVGERFDMSGDGTTIVVRLGDSTVEVYRIDATTGESILLGGTSIDVCGGNAAKGSKTVSLGKTATAGGAAASGDWVTVSCEDFDQYRGKVVALKLDASEETWTTIATIEGQAKGDRFGWATVMSLYGQSIATIAVSSPNHDGKRRMVQVFGFGSALVVSQNGDDMVGQSVGDQFRFSLDMDMVGLRYLVIGAPNCNDLTGYAGISRGCVDIYKWGRSEGWVLVRQPMVGQEDGDKLGRSVAISKNGQRFAATSFLHGRQAGVVSLYERDGPYYIKHVASFEEDEQASRWGYGVALNENGSLLVAGASRAKNAKNASVGKVRAYLDANPFCGIPTTVTPKNDRFLERKMCFNNQNGGTVGSTTCDFWTTYDPSTGGEVSCEWVDGLATQTPSSTPSTVPTSSPVATPSDTPSSSPSVDPSVAPSTNLTDENENSGNGTGEHDGSGSTGIGGGSGTSSEDGSSFPREHDTRQATSSLVTEGAEGSWKYIWNLLEEWKIVVMFAIVGLLVAALAIGAYFAKCSGKTKVTPETAAEKYKEDEDAEKEVETSTVADEIDIEQGISLSSLEEDPVTKIKDLEQQLDALNVQQQVE